MNIGKLTDCDLSGLRRAGWAVGLGLLELDDTLPTKLWYRIELGLVTKPTLTLFVRRLRGSVSIIDVTGGRLKLKKKKA